MRKYHVVIGLIFSVFFSTAATATPTFSPSEEPEGAEITKPLKNQYKTLGHFFKKSRKSIHSPENGSQKVHGKNKSKSNDSLEESEAKEKVQEMKRAIDSLTDLIRIIENTPYDEEFCLPEEVTQSLRVLQTQLQELGMNLSLRRSLSGKALDGGHLEFEV